MKRLIAAVAFATLAVPALADNRPSEQAAPSFEQYNPQ
jgi:hypothetical protein